MNCPRCCAPLELYSPGRVNWQIVECSPCFPLELRSEVLRLFSSGAEALFKCSGSPEHFFRPSDFPELERRELERQNLESIEASKKSREFFRRQTTGARSR